MKDGNEGLLTELTAIQAGRGTSATFYASGMADWSESIVCACNIAAEDKLRMPEAGTESAAMSK